MRDKMGLMLSILANLERAEEPLQGAFTDAMCDRTLSALIAEGRRRLREAKEHVERCIARHGLSEQPLPDDAAAAWASAQEWGEKRNWE